MSNKKFFIDYLMPIDYFEKKAKRVNINLIQGIRRRQFSGLTKFIYPLYKPLSQRKLGLLERNQISFSNQES